MPHLSPKCVALGLVRHKAYAAASHMCLKRVALCQVRQGPYAVLSHLCSHCVALGLVRHKPDAPVSHLCLKCAALGLVRHKPYAPVSHLCLKFAALGLVRHASVSHVVLKWRTCVVGHLEGGGSCTLEEYVLRKRGNGRYGEPELQVCGRQSAGTVCGRLSP